MLNLHRLMPQVSCSINTPTMAYMQPFNAHWKPGGIKQSGECCRTMEWLRTSAGNAARRNIRSSTTRSCRREFNSNLQQKRNLQTLLNSFSTEHDDCDYQHRQQQNNNKRISVVT